MSFKKLSIMLLSAVSLAALLGGCGSSSKEGTASLTGSSVASVGDTACIQCHSAVKDPLTGDSLITQYQNSSPHKVVNNGNGCEACHGGGAQHNGVGPIAFPKPNADRCATCHTGTNSNTAFATSNHAQDDTHLSGTCVRCHQHEGAILSNISGITGDDTVFATNPMPAYTGAYTNIKCETCHEHGGGLRSILAKNALSQNVAWNPSKTTGAKNNQFNLCTSCHTLYNFDGSKLLANGVVSVNGSVTGKVVSKHAADGDWNRILISTHYDDASTDNKIEGYNIRMKGANPCFDCHGHEAKAETRAVMTDPTKSTIHTDWAQSAHAGGLLTKKYKSNGAAAPTLASVLAAGVEDEPVGNAWVHYPWSKTSERATCQRCHTATGAANYLNNPAGYDPAKNDFSHLSGWTAAAGSKQKEVLYCWGCHTNAGKGTLRAPGAITAKYTGSSYTFPNLAGSNICMTCHVEQENGDTIKAKTDPGTNLGFINSHYLTAGGTLFGTSGYEYAGKDYANPAYFAHDKIGSKAAAGTGSNGPCAGCHMTTPNSHKFDNVTKTAGVITALTSSACITCHSGDHGAALAAGSADAAAFLETEKHHYHAALDALNAALTAKGVVFTPGYPYFALKNWAGVYPAANWKDTMGAAFNYNLLHHEPGAYAHNRVYTKRLIFDSIDFIDNGVLDGTINVTGDAATYLGATRP